MAKVIKLRKGLDINLNGVADKITNKVAPSSLYALIPDDFTGVIPKVVVREGDRVKAGSPLFVNKRCPSVCFVSPVSGTVSCVERGDKRKVLSIQVVPDAEQTYVEFEKIQVEGTSAEAMVQYLAKTGLLGYMKQRPYDVVVSPEDKPKAIFVSAFNTMPLAADFSYVVKGQEAIFQQGLDALACIAPVHVGISPEQANGFMANLKNVDMTVFDGPNPAGNVGVHINHVNPINKGEIIWTIGAEEVLFIGRLMQTGKVDLTRIIAIGGSEVKRPSYYSVKVGAQTASLLKDQLCSEEHTRIISGNPLVGYPVSLNGFLGAHATEVTVIPEGDDIHELLGWISPRFNQFSVNRSYFSWLLGKKKTYSLDARVKGGERHIIMSGEYDRVFPMDIYAGYLIKAILTGDIDRMEALGIYEVAPEDFAVAEFVDSSKLELQRIVRQGLDMLRKEMA